MGRVYHLVDVDAYPTLEIDVGVHLTTITWQDPWDIPRRVQPLTEEFLDIVRMIAKDYHEDSD